MDLAAYGALCDQHPRGLAQELIGVSANEVFDRGVRMLKSGGPVTRDLNWVSSAHFKQECAGQLDFGGTRTAKMLNGNLVVLGPNTMGRKATDLTALGNSASWTSIPGCPANGYDAAYGNSMYVAVGASGAIASGATLSLTARTSGTTQTLRTVIFGGGKFVAVGDAGTVITSTDGITWTVQTFPTTSAVYSVTYGNGIYVAVCFHATNRIYTSPDAVTWTLQNTSAINGSVSGTCVHFGNGRFVMGTAGSLFGYSDDGVNWYASTQPGNNSNVLRMDYLNGVYVAVATNHYIFTSTDGVAWVAMANLPAPGWNQTPTTYASSGGILLNGDYLYYIGSNGLAIYTYYLGNPLTTLETNGPATKYSAM
jgi:hypothetical protein